MVNSNSKGDRRERELVNWLDANGWTVIRVPASGSATTRDLPDILFGSDGSAVATEVKSSSGDPIYLDGEEVDALLRFANDFGARPLVSVKFDLERSDDAYGARRPGFYFLPVSVLHKTDGGNFRAKKELAHRNGIREVDLAGV